MSGRRSGIRTCPSRPSRRRGSSHGSREIYRELSEKRARRVEYSKRMIEWPSWKIDEEIKGSFGLK